MTWTESGEYVAEKAWEREAADAERAHQERMLYLHGGPAEPEFDTTDEERAVEYYHEMLSLGEDPIEAAWEAVEAFGLVKRFEPVDPMEPDYHALAREPEQGDAWDAAEAPAIQ